MGMVIHFWEGGGATKSLKRGPKYVGLPSNLRPKKILALLRNARLILYVTATFFCNYIIVIIVIIFL